MAEPLEVLDAYKAGIIDLRIAQQRATNLCLRRICKSLGIRTFGLPASPPVSVFRQKACPPMANERAKPLTDAEQNSQNALSAGFISGTMFFFASVIKSGEPWTEVCEERFSEAKEHLSKLNFDRTAKDRTAKESVSAHG